MKTCAALVACLLPAWGQVATRPAGVVTPTASLNPAKPMRIALGTFYDLERRFDGKLNGLNAKDPVDLLGTTRGVYLEGYGAVFTTEISLIITPTTNPFRQTITPELAAQVHQRKVAQVPAIKQAMREMLKTVAMTLIQIPDNQQVVIAVRVDYLKWEDTLGLPGLIVAHADRRSAMADNIQMEEQ